MIELYVNSVDQLELYIRRGNSGKSKREVRYDMCEKDGICKMHKNVGKGKNLSKVEKEKFSTYPHSKHKKTWKKADFQKVIHIIHTKRGEFGGLLTLKKRTNVLVSYHENRILSKKERKNVDF